MYNFSGIAYRIWGVCGIILIMGIICILFEKPWKKAIKILDCKLGLIMLVIAICLGGVYGSRILWPEISFYTGKFIESNRNSRVAPPLPVTYEYVFWNGEAEKQVFYIDVFSKEEIFPDEFVQSQEYIIYYDEFTNVIVKVEVVELEPISSEQ